MTISPTGSIYMVNTISSAAYSFGENDVWVTGLTLGGGEIFVENIGGSLNDNPGGIVYNPISGRINVFAST